jgi:hypothetical protein
MDSKDSSEPSDLLTEIYIVVSDPDETILEEPKKIFPKRVLKFLALLQIFGSALTITSLVN